MILSSWTSLFPNRSALETSKIPVYRLSVCPYPVCTSSRNRFAKSLNPGCFPRRTNLTKALARSAVPKLVGHVLSYTKMSRPPHTHTKKAAIKVRSQATHTQPQTESHGHSSIVMRDTFSDTMHTHPQYSLMALT